MPWDSASTMKQALKGALRMQAQMRRPAWWNYRRERIVISCGQTLGVMMDLRLSLLLYLLPSTPVQRLVRRTRPATALLVALVVAITGCAIKPLRPILITDLKQVAGTWEGWVIAREGSDRFRLQLLVQPDGRFTWVVLRGGTHLGTMRIVDGALQWGVWRQDKFFPDGTITLAEQQGTEYLTWTRADGVLLAEFDRPSASPR